MKKHKVLRKILIFFGSLLLIFGLINIIWLVGIKSPYKKFAEGMEKIEGPKMDGITRTYYEKQQDGYEYYIKSPTYLSDNGFMYVINSAANMVIMDENGTETPCMDVQVKLYVWPQLFGGYKYGVDIQKEGVWEQIYIDDQGNYLPQDSENIELNKYLESVVKENETEISKLLKLANEQWELK